MKKLLVVLATMSGMVFADAIVTPAGNVLVAMPSGATLAANLALGNTPFFNNISSDGSQLNAGFYVTNSGGPDGNPGLHCNGPCFSGGAITPASQYLGTVANNNAAALAFGLVRQATSINVTVMYQNSSLNAGVGGTAFGIYDAGTLAQTQIYAAGSIPGSVGGAGVNLNTAGISGNGTYGFYATVCQFPNTSTNCYTFFSDTGLNPNVTNQGSSFIVEGPGIGTPHQHFALFTLAGNATTYYLAFENSVSSTAFDGTAGPEKYGDFNDVIFRITTAVPEPASLSMMGLGLLGLGLIGRKLRK
jgi:hypothetical protein